MLTFFSSADTRLAVPALLDLESTFSERTASETTSVSVDLSRDLRCFSPLTGLACHATAASTEARRQEANLMTRKSDGAFWYGTREEFVLVSLGGNVPTLIKQVDNRQS
jgi:hypothetical protein